MEGRDEEFLSPSPSRSSQILSLSLPSKFILHYSPLTESIMSLPTALKEIRLHLCQSNSASSGLRNYITKNYSNLKSNNPNLKFLIREANGTQARVYARFGQ